LSDLARRSEIHDLILRYFRGLDDRDLGLVRSCFAAGATAFYDGTGELAGLEEIMRHLHVVERLGPTMHVAGNHYLDFQAADAATAETYAIAYVQPANHESAELRIRGLRYTDRVELQAERWLLTRREHRCLWMCSAPLSSDAG
jgi:hypothetical protein